MKTAPPAMTAPMRRSRASGTPFQIAAPMLNAIAVMAKTFAERGMARWASQRRIGGPNSGWVVSQVCKRLEPRAKAHAASTRNGVVGRPGNRIPSAPSAKKTRPRKM